MKKHIVKKINGVKVVTEIKSDHDRPLLPPGAVFDLKTKYDRKREKENLRKEIDADET